MGRHPRLTDKMIETISDLVNQAEAGEMLHEGGELEKIADDVYALDAWLHKVRVHRARRGRAR